MHTLLLLLKYSSMDTKMKCCRILDSNYLCICVCIYVFELTGHKPMNAVIKALFVDNCSNVHSKLRCVRKEVDKKIECNI